MREDQLCPNCRQNHKKNSDYFKNKLKEQMERSEKIIKKAKEKNDNV